MRHPLLELDVALHAEPARHRRGHPHIVRLHRSGNQNRVGLGRLRRAEIELELTDLVAAERHAGAVVPLDQQPRTAQRIGKVVHRLDRRRQMTQPHPREPGQPVGKIAWCKQGRPP